MSLINGDKSRQNRLRKQKLRRRAKAAAAKALRAKNKSYFYVRFYVCPGGNVGRQSNELCEAREGTSPERCTLREGSSQAARQGRTGGQRCCRLTHSAMARDAMIAA